MAKIELWQFQHSHFCEKARWILDHKQVAFERRNLVPGFHIGVVRRATGQAALPVLFVDDQAVFDSAMIAARLEVDRPDPPLFPTDPTEREQALIWERRLGSELGPFIRRGWFRELIDERDYAVALLADGATEKEQRRFARLWPVMKLAFRVDMKLTRRKAADGWERTRAMLDEIARAVERTGFLAGSAFSIADLTAVALLAPILPKAWRVLGEPIDPPASLAAVTERFGGHAAVDWAQQVYRDHRGNPLAR